MRRRGGDLLFQSTRPRGARPDNPLRAQKLAARFNPRAREGRDRAFRRVSITFLCFNPRAREGRDGVNEHENEEEQGFNPRAREGRDERDRMLAGSC